jgi:hypothetical protein
MGDAITTWTDAVSYARELIDPWARDGNWNECDGLSHELEETLSLPWGEAFMEAAAQLEIDISELIDVANYLVERPQLIGTVSDTELRELMGDDAPASL